MSSPLELALEALDEPCGCVNVHGKCKHDVAITALKEVAKTQGEPAYWLAGTGDLYSSVAIAEQYGAAKPYIPLYTSAPTIPAGLIDSVEALFGEYWNLAFEEGRSRVSYGDAANLVLHRLRVLLAAAPEYKVERP
jgi:hypothetical protein